MALGVEALEDWIEGWSFGEIGARGFAVWKENYLCKKWIDD